MTLQKTAITSEHLQAQTVLELPQRDMLLVTVVVTNLLNNLTVDVDVSDVNVGVQVCAVVNALTTILAGRANRLQCTIDQE